MSYFCCFKNKLKYLSSLPNGVSDLGSFKKVKLSLLSESFNFQYVYFIFPIIRDVKFSTKLRCLKVACRSKYFKRWLTFLQIARSRGQE